MPHGSSPSPAANPFHRKTTPQINLFLLGICFLGTQSVTGNPTQLFQWLSEAGNVVNGDKIRKETFNSMPFYNFLKKWSHMYV